MNLFSQNTQNTIKAAYTCAEIISLNNSFNMFQVQVLKAWRNLIWVYQHQVTLSKAQSRMDRKRWRSRDKKREDVSGVRRDEWHLPWQRWAGGDLATWWWCTTHWFVVYLCSSHPCSPHPPTSQTRSLGCTQIGSLTPLKPYRDDWEKTLQSGRQQGGLLPHHSGHSNGTFPFFSPWTFWGPHHAGT